MYQGLGNQIVEASDDYLINLGLTEFTFTPTQEAAKTSQEFRAGELVNSEELPGTTTYRYTLSYNKLNWARQGFHLNQRSRSRTIVMPKEVHTGTVPSNGQIANAYITAANDTVKRIKLAITSGGDWGLPGILTRTASASTAPANPTQVQVDTTGNKFVVDTDLAGAPYVWVEYDQYTAQTYGGPTGTQKIGEFEYWGEIYIPDMGATGELFHVPKSEILTIPAFTINNGVPVIAVECSMKLPDGWDYPWEVVDKSTAVLVA